MDNSIFLLANPTGFTDRFNAAATRKKSFDREIFGTNRWKTAYGERGAADVTFNMKAVIQRVTKASVTVNGEVISSIQNGLCVLIGIKRDDTLEDINYIVRKILNTRIFDDKNGKRWSANVVEKQYEVLCISQFTLYHVLKGNKLDFHRAMSAAESEPFYNKFLEKLRTSYKPDLVKDGQFGAMMDVCIINNGPVTLEIESPTKSVVNENIENTD